MCRALGLVIAVAAAGSPVIARAGGADHAPSPEGPPAAAPASAAASPPAPAPGVVPVVPAVLDGTGPRLGGVSAVWYDRRGALFTVEGDELRIYAGDGAPQLHPAPAGERRWIAGAQGGDTVVAVASSSGVISRRVKGEWSTQTLPLEPEDPPRALAIDGAGSVFLLTGRALWVWRAETTRSYPLPEGARGRLFAMSVSLGGRAYLTGDAASVWAFDGRLFDALTPVGADEATLEARWSACWISADGRRLWVRVGADRVVRLDTLDGAATVYRLPQLPGELEQGGSSPEVGAITGETLAAGDRVYATRGRAVFGLEEARFTRLAELGEGPVDALVLAPPSPSGHALAGGQLHPFPLRGGADLGPETDEEPGAMGRRPPYPSRGLFVPSVDLRVGPSFALHRGSAGRAASLGIDAGVGVLIAPSEPGPDPMLFLWPQLGYTHDTHPSFGHHGLYLANGFGFGSSLIAGFYTPGLIVGAGPRDRMIGFRHGLSAQLLWGLVGVEVRHQLQDVGGALEQDLGVMFEFNLAAAIWLALALNMK